MVVYATATETSVGKLFMAGVVPGLLLGLVLMVTIYIMARVKDITFAATGLVQGNRHRRASKSTGWGLMLIVIILDGIYSGMFTPYPKRRLWLRSTRRSWRFLSTRT